MRWVPLAVVMAVVFGAVLLSDDAITAAWVTAVATFSVIFWTLMRARRS
jgi:hypothetical protein